MCAVERSCHLGLWLQRVQRADSKPSAPVVIVFWLRRFAEEGEAAYRFDIEVVQILVPTEIWTSVDALVHNDENVFYGCAGR